jgi:hypothetical protein
MVTRDEFIELLASDFTRFMHDNFLSTEQQVQETTGSGYIDSLSHELTLNTGIAASSSARFYYNYNIFNPYYSTLVVKARISHMTNVFAFIGFKETPSAPTFNMTESHAGFMIKDGKLYISVGDGGTPTPNQQRLEIKGWTPTNWLLFKILKNEFWMRPLPVMVPYFNDIEWIETERKWAKVGTLETAPPQNKVHYIHAYITNTTGANRFWKLSHVVYGERYAD